MEFRRCFIMVFFCLNLGPDFAFYTAKSLTLMYIDLERDSVIKVRALMTLAAYSVQQIKKRAFFCFRLLTTLKISKSCFKISKICM